MQTPVLASLSWVPCTQSRTHPRRTMSRRSSPMESRGEPGQGCSSTRAGYLVRFARRSRDLRARRKLPDRRRCGGGRPGVRGGDSSGAFLRARDGKAPGARRIGNYRHRHTKTPRSFFGSAKENKKPRLPDASDAELAPVLHHDVEAVEGIKDYELIDISELGDLAGGQVPAGVS
jgi:hypothetical protein